VQYDRPHNEVCKRPLRRHVFEQSAIHHVDLRAQRRRKHKLPNRAREPGEESVKREARHEDAVHELRYARQDEEDEEGIDEF